MCAAEELSGAALQRLADTVDDILFVLQTHPTLVVEYLSPSIGQLTGHDAEAIVQHPARILRAIHPDDRPRFWSLARRWLDRDAPGQHQEEVLLLSPDGRTHRLRVRTRATDEPPHGPRRIVGIAALIPERASDCHRTGEGGESLTLRELHHHLKNSMQLVSSLIYLQARGARAEHERNALTSARARIRSVGLLYETLLQEPDRRGVAMDRYLSHLVSPVGHPLAAHRSDIRIDAQIEPVVLDVDRAIACGLLVNELLANALTHAFPDGEGQVVVQLDQHGETIVLLVRDRGVGLPLVLPDEMPKLGLRLVRRLAAQLDGELHVERDQGTTVRVRFTLPPP